jgi:hypothetical protein
MKTVFIVYHDILEDRLTRLFDDLKIDYFTQWENVKGKGHCSDAHLGTRTFPGFNMVRMIAFQEECAIDGLIDGVINLNNEIIRNDDKIRIFQMPLEKIV